jgi:hypothetical protein
LTRGKGSGLGQLQNGLRSEKLTEYIFD